MPPATLKDPAAAQLLAHAMVQEAFELAADEEPDEYLDKARELFVTRVDAALHHVFDAALAEYAR
jgi:hypothetical protein